MPKLIAEFQIELSGQCLVSLPDSVKLSFDIEIHGFDVTIKLLTWQKAKKIDEENWINIIERINLRVGRIESEFPQREDGVRDYTIQEPYFSKRVENYRAAACEAMNRLIKNFKFQMNTPFLDEFQQYGNAVGLPKWIDDKGIEVGKGGLIIFAEKIPGLWGELGVCPLRKEDIQRLQLALGGPREPNVYDQVLAGAR